MKSFTIQYLIQFFVYEELMIQNSTVKPSLIHPTRISTISLALSVIHYVPSIIFPPISAILSASILLCLLRLCLFLLLILLCFFPSVYFSLISFCFIPSPSYLFLTRFSLRSSHSSSSISSVSS